MSENDSSRLWQETAGGMLSEHSLQLLTNYRDLLIEWNSRFNLTALKEASAIDRLLIAESLRLVPVFQAASDPTQQPVRAIDIGSGAGIPGIPLAFAFPGSDLTLIDATGKKVKFLQHVIDSLALPNVQAIHARAEDLGQTLDHRSQYDIAMARAVAPLPVLLELAMPLLAGGGVALFPKGEQIEAELEQAHRAGALLGGSVRSASLLPGGDDLMVTRLVIADKIDATPERYPRQAGMPAKMPLGRRNS